MTDQSVMPKPAFETISPTKRRRILDVAAAEFAQKGFHGANVGVVAQRAGIAKGAIYLYFDSKLDLYFATLLDGAETLEAIFQQVEGEGGSVSAQLRNLYTRAAAGLAAHPDHFRMYCDLATGSDPDLVEIADEIELASSRFYRRLVEQGQERGEVRADIPAPLLAVALDTVFVNFFAARVSGYQARRLKVFWPERLDAVSAFQAELDDILVLLTAGLAPGRRVAGVSQQEGEHV